MDPNDLLEGKQQDPDIGPVVKWIAEGIRPPWSTGDSRVDS